MTLYSVFRVETRMSGVSGGWVRAGMPGPAASSRAAEREGPALPEDHHRGRAGIRCQPPGRPACPRSLTRARAPAGTFMITGNRRDADRTPGPVTARRG